YLVLTRADELESLEIFTALPDILYKLYRTGARTMAFTKSAGARLERDSLLSARVGQTIVVRKSLYLEAGGLMSQLSFDDSLRAMMLYALFSQSLEVSTISKLRNSLAAYSGK